MQTWNADPYTQASVKRREELCGWIYLSGWVFFVKIDVDASFSAVISISNSENLFALLYIQGFAGSLAFEQQEVHKQFHGNWPEIARKAGMQLDCPAIRIIHLYRLTKKVVYIDCLFKCPNYASWKSYEDAMKLSIIILRKASSSSHQGKKLHSLMRLECSVREER